MDTRNICFIHIKLWFAQFRNTVSQIYNVDYWLLKSGTDWQLKFQDIIFWMFTPFFFWSFNTHTQKKKLQRLITKVLLRAQRNWSQVTRDFCRICNTTRKRYSNKGNKKNLKKKKVFFEVYTSNNIYKADWTVSF